MPTTCNPGTSIPQVVLSARLAKSDEAAVSFIVRQRHIPARDAYTGVATLLMR